MCGIAGALAVVTAGARCSEMLNAIGHRGEPACQNEVWLAEKYALGTNRLAISDPSRGVQPIISSNGRFVLVYNGELYNTYELHSELEGYHSLRTKCDSELILAGFLQWGEDLIQRLRGMFALCILDTETGDYYLARDRLGVKPLFYRRVDVGLEFCSELKGFAEGSFKIHTVEPGTFLTRSGCHRYYSVPQFNHGELDQDLSGLRSSLQENFLSTVASHLVDANGSVACLLSGGVDSASLLYAASRLTANITAWTFAIGEGHSEDLVHARLVCEQLKIPLNTVSIAVADLQKFYMDKGVYCAETYEPPLVRNATSYYFLCRAVRAAGYKFALSGEGADEVFGGYSYLDRWEGKERDQKVRDSLTNVHRTYLQMCDRASMFATLEVRVPYMDHCFVEHVAQMPAEVRHDGEKNKAILRDLFPDLPARVRLRSKTGMNQGAGYGSNDPGEGIFFDAVSRYYMSNPDAYDQDKNLVLSSSLSLSLDLENLEEVYNAARFIRHGFDRLENCHHRVQLNTAALRHSSPSRSEASAP